MLDEDKKKRTKKLVVEETFVPEETTEVEETKVEIEEPEVKEEEVEPIVHEKEEAPEESILIPKEEDKKYEDVSDEPQEKDSKVSVFWVILLALFIIASLIGGGMLIFKAGVEKGKLETGATPESTATPVASPEASPATEVKREDLKVQVLNGTGQAGVAASAQEYLEGLGYKEVETGNAETSDFTETEISIKDSKKAYLGTLKSDLEKEYEVASTTGTLSSGNDFDVVVTIGTSTK